VAVKPGLAGWLTLGTIGLWLTAPAAVADWLLADTPFCLIGSRGYWWAGSAWLAARHGAGLATPVLPLAWHLSWQDAPAIAVATPDGSGSLRAGFAGIHVDLPPFRLELADLPLPPTLAGHAPSGQLLGIDGRFDCSYRAVCRGRAALRIENALLALFPADRLGTVDIAVRADGRQASAHLVADGKAALAGAATLGWRDGRLAMNGDVRPTERASPALTRTLASLKAAGTNALSFGAHWLDGGGAR
jgi:hypothetical protein